MNEICDSTIHSEIPYLPFDLNKYFEHPKKLPSFSKCRVLGYLHWDKNKHYLRNLDDYSSHCEDIPVNLEEIEPVPVVTIPQPVQIFGEFRLIHEIDKEEIYWNMIKDFEMYNTKDWILTLKARVIQYVPQSVIYYLNDIINKITTELPK